MDTIHEHYIEYCNKKGDINEHLLTLRAYAGECDSILELGTRGCVSAWAFALGMLEGGGDNRVLIVNDITSCDVEELEEAIALTSLTFKKYWQNDLTLELGCNIDLVFIDTWHVYGQLIRELEKFSKITNKYMILHDIESFGYMGEPMNSEDVRKVMIKYGMSLEEVTMGLMPAVNHFLEKYGHEWTIKEVYTNNNGLLILEKHDS